MTITETTAAVDKPAGLQLMEAIRDGHLPPPPAAQLLGLELEAVTVGVITFAFTADERFSNGVTTHGGILATLADFALSTAVMTQIGSGGDVVTTNLQITYLRPAPIGARYRCEGKVVHRGRTLHHAEAVITDERGREIARATATCHVRSG